MENTDKLLYKVQRYDKRYPTLKRLIDLDYGEKGYKTHLSFIVQVHEVILDDGNEILLDVKDFTGLVKAKILKK